MAVRTVHTAQLPVSAEHPAIPSQLQQMAGEALLIGLSDGSVLKLPLTELPPIDLASCVVHAACAARCWRVADCGQT